MSSSVGEPSENLLTPREVGSFTIGFVAPAVPTLVKFPVMAVEI